MNRMEKRKKAEKRRMRSKLLVLVVAFLMVLQYSVVPLSGIALATQAGEDQALEEVTDNAAEMPEAEAADESQEAEDLPEVDAEPADDAAAPVDEADTADTEAEVSEPEETEAEVAETADEQEAAEEPEQTPEDAADPEEQEAVVSDVPEDVQDEAEVSEPVDETEPEETEEVVDPYDAKSFEGLANGVYVTVDAPKGAFPEGTTMTVKGVKKSKVIDAVEGAVDGDVEKVRAVDITFFDKDGNEIQPLKKINVQMKAPDFSEDANLSVVHIEDNGNAEVMENAEFDGNEAEFRTKHFSVYVIVETGEDARLFVDFVLADGETTKTMMINERQIPQIDQYIFDPGANEPEGTIFKGWTTVEDYDSKTPAKTIKEVRDEIAEKLEAGVSDGDEVTYYAMVFNSYEVTYLDERGIFVQVDQVLQRVDDTSSPTHNVTLNYTPYPTDEEGVSAEFMGWQQLTPQVTGEMRLYQPGDSFTLEANEYVLKAYTQKGHWLSFDENLSGASYTEPQFIAIGDKPTEPAEPTRTGYTFDGWYTEDASSARDGQVAGSQFNFNQALEENQTIYAKWNRANTASYSVVIWKQNVDGEHYDYGETVTVNNATVGNNTYAVTARNNGVRINTGSGNVDKAYDFFHLRTENGIDAAKPVAAEGNTVINVYLDRDTITYNFQYGYGNTQTYSGLYGTSFTQWPDAGTGYEWYYGSYYFNLPLTEFNPAAADSTSTNITFTRERMNNSSNLYVYKMTTNGQWSYTNDDLIATARIGDGNWIPAETYIGFTLDAYRNGSTGSWVPCTPSTSIRHGNNLYLRYSRNQYSIVYNDGIFIDGSGNPVEAVNRGELTDLKENNVYYESNISSKNKTPEYDGFVFLGWYDNEFCVGEPYAFTTMPANNVTLYAKWGIAEYAVKLHGNDSTADPIKYTSATQATTFYVDNGEKIGNVGGERIYYDLVGWYSDEALKHPFDFDSFTVNEMMVGKYGKLYSDSEIDPAYPTTIGELNLYAKWRDKLVGSDGIVVQYVDGEHGTGAEEADTNKYVPGSFANAHGAFTAEDPNEYVFSHWEVQKWNGTAYEASGVKVFPGETFEIKAGDAKITDEDGVAVAPADLDKDGTYTYTIQVKAVYIEKDKEIKTFINWYNNYDGGLVAKSENIKINEATPIPAAPTREGYVFKGWIRGIEEDGTTTTLTDLWLTYKDGKYYYDDNGTEKEAKNVAADEMLVGDGTQHHALYAKWQPIISVRVSADTQTVTYNGTEQSYDYTAEGAYKVEYKVGDQWTTTRPEGVKLTEIKPEVKGIDADTYTGTVSVKIEAEDGADVIIAEDGDTATATATLIITPITDKVTVTVKENSDEVTYDGQEHTISGYESMTADNDLYDVTTAVKETETADWTVTETNAGTYDMGIVAADFENTDPNFTNVEFVVEDGQLVINPITDKVTVTVKENSDEVTYDGQEHTISGYESMTADNDLYDVTTAVKETETEDWTVTETNAGTYDMGIVAADFENTDPNFTNVEFVVEDGQLVINPYSEKVTVTITENSDEVTYDGKPHTIEGYESMVSGNELYDVKAVKETPTDAWTVTETDQGSYDMGIVAADFENTDPNFTNVVFEIVDGKLIIEPTDEKVIVTITENSAEVTYDGQEHTITGYESIVASDPNYDVTKAVKETPTDEWTVTKTNAGTYDMGIVAADFENTDPNFTNVEFVVVDGQLKINPITDKVTVTITENSDEVTYDGKEHTITGYESMTADNDLYDVTTAVKETETADWTVTKTNAGTYDMGIVAADFENTDPNFTNVEFVVEDGQLVINPIKDKVTVTITEKSDKVEYDGEAHTISGYASIVADNDLYDVTTAVNETPTDDWTVTETNAGTYDMGIKATDFENIDKNFSNVEFVVADGQLVITPYSKTVTVTVTENKDTVEYDGKPHTINGYESMVSDNELYDVKTGVKETETADWTVTETNAGTYDMGIVAGDFENIDKNFADVKFVVVDGQLVITPYSKTVTVTVTENKDTVEYDGKPHTIKGYETIVSDNELYDVTTGVKETETAAWTVTETNAGTYDMGIVAGDFENIDKNFADVKFVVVDGQLVITPYSKTVTVTVTENSDEVTYDGKAHTINGYESMVADDELYDVTTGVKATETDAWTVTETNAGTYDMGIVAGDFENIDKNFADVKFVVVDGQLVIKPYDKTVTVTITENKDTVTYDGNAHTIKGYASMESDNDLYNVATAVKATETDAWTVTKTNAGTYDMGIVPADFENTDKNFAKVEFKVVDGQLVIKPVSDEVVVTIVGNNDTKMYDGKAHSAEGYVVTSISNELYKEDNFNFTGTDKATRTNAGKTNMGLAPEQFENTSKNFTKVTFVVTDGYMEITKRTVVLTSATDEKQYNGKPLTNDEITVTGDGFVEGEGATYDVTGSQTLVGSSENEFTYTLNEGTNKSNYDITTKFGTLTVVTRDAKYDITVKANSAEDKYDGTAKTVAGVETLEFTVDGNTYTVEGLTTTDPSEINAGTYPNNITGTAVVKDKDGNDVSSEFAVHTENGQLVINKRDITIVSASDEKTYDGTALTNHNYEIKGDGLAETDQELVNITGTQTLVGSSDNTINDVRIIRKASEPSLGAKILMAIKALGEAFADGEEDVTDNYNITEEEGTLTVTDDNVDIDKVVNKTHNEKETFAAGDTVEFTITVTNIYDCEMNATVEEQEGVAIEGDSTFKLKAGETVKLTATYTLTEKDVLAGTFTNKVSVNFTPVDPDNPEPKPYDNEDEVKDFAHMTVDKKVVNEPEDGEVFRTDETIEYEITVTNDGTKTLSDITVKDDLTGEEWTIETLKVGETKTFKTEYTVTADDAKAGEVTNEATAKGNDPDGDPIDGTPDKITTKVDETEKNGHITVTKTVVNEPEDGEVFRTGETIKYEITVTNDGKRDLTDITVTDELTGDEWTIDLLKEGDSKTFKAEYTVTEDDAEEGEVTNVAEAAADYPEGDPVDTTPGKNTTDVDGPAKNGHLTVEKTVTNEPKDGEIFRTGETIKYEITVTNDGEQDLTDITVADELTGDEWTIDALKEGKSKTFKAEYTVTEDDAEEGEVTNVAVAEAEYPDGDKVDNDPGEITTDVDVPEEAPAPRPAPKTGDTTMIYTFVVLFAASVALLIMLLFRRRKESR